MSDGYGYVNPAALEALTLSWGDTALANEGGSSSVITGWDSAHSAAKAVTTEPETVQSGSLLDSISEWSKKYLSPGIPVFSPLVPFGMQMPESLTPKGVGEGAVAGAIKGTKSSINWRNIIGSVLLVIVALMILSKGLGMFGAEKVSVIAKLAGKGAE